MAFLRSKQIKLNAAGDLLIGGVGGNGAILAKGTAGQVLKATAGGLEYAGLTAAEIVRGASTVDADLTSLEGRMLTAESDISTLELDVNAAETLIGNIITAVGLDSEDGTFVPFTGTNYLDTSTSIVTGLTALDTRIKTLADTAASDTFVGTGVGPRALSSITKNAAINEVFAKASVTKVDADNAPTINDDSADGYKIGDVWVNGVNAYVALDVTVGAAVWSRIDQNMNAALFTYKGTLDASAAANIPATPESGDTYKISVAGDFEATAGMPFVNVGDFIVYTGAGWDKIDSTDPTIVGTAGSITVDGNADLGYTVAIANDYAGQASITTLGTITTGTWNGTVVGQAYGGTGIATETVAGDAGKVLTVGATGVLEYAYVGALKDATGADVALVSNGILVAVADAATAPASPALAYTTKGYVDGLIADVTAGAATKSDQDFVVGATPDANYEVTLAAAPVGDVSVYFNGIKLRKTGYTVIGTTVALDDSVNGYAAEENDVISVSYMKSGV